MTILWFIIIGIIAGWIAGELTKGSGFGLLGNLVVGVIGAVLGGMVFDLLNLSAGGLLGQLVMSVIGALVLLFILSLIPGTRRV